MCGGYGEDSGRLWDFVLHFTCHCLGKTRNLPNGQSQGPRATRGGGKIVKGTFSDLENGSQGRLENRTLIQQESTHN